jgi:hypothetical protein
MSQTNREAVFVIALGSVLAVGALVAGALGLGTQFAAGLLLVTVAGVAFGLLSDD